MNYNAVVIDHFERPRNVAAALKEGVVTGAGGDVESGVWLEFAVDLDGQQIRQAWFRAYGCPHTLALASWLTESLVGQTLDSGYTLDKQDIVAALDLPTEKLRSVLVAEDALRACADQIAKEEAS